MSAVPPVPAAAPAPLARDAAPYRQEGGATLIEVSLRRLPQLFNSLDPSPFHEKDLDPEADAYLVSAAREVGTRAPIKLVIHLPAAELAWTDAAQVGEAIHNYFSYRQRDARRELRLIFRRGRISLAIGLVFLAACISLRELLGVLHPTTFGRVLSEGLVILGWVAMWGPLQIFLYDWWPIAQRAEVLARLAGAPVEVRRSEA